MKIFDIEGNTVVLNAQILGIPPFKELWRRDKSKDKERAYKEISYITFLCDTSLDNPYRGYREVDRDRTLKRDFMGNETWEPDLLVNEAIQKFKEFQQTVNSRLLMGAKKAADKLAEYFESVDFKELDKSGKPVYSADSLMSNLGHLAGVTRSLKMLEDEVLREQIESNLAMGGSEIGEYEIPKNELQNYEG